MTSRFSAVTFGTLALTLALARPAPAAEPLGRADLDIRIHAALADAINQGAPVFNAGNPDGCYYLYQGALTAVTPLLDHRPALQQSVTAKVQQAKALRTASDRAFALRSAIDEVRATIEKDVPQLAARTLWDRLGGEPAVRAVVHEFVLSAAPDPKVNFLRNGQFKLDEKGVANLEQLLVELVSAVSGGPLKYTGRDMKTVHTGMKITDAEFNAIAGHLIAVLKKYKVPPREIDELVGIIASTRKDIVGQ
jgi:hemoglobin